MQEEGQVKNKAVTTLLTGPWGQGSLSDEKKGMEEDQLGIQSWKRF